MNPRSFFINMPSAEGLLRYPQTAGYFVLDDNMWLPPVTNQQGAYPCTCTFRCSRPCDGSCECEACKWRYIQENPSANTVAGDA